MRVLVRLAAVLGLAATSLIGAPAHARPGRDAIERMLADVARIADDAQLPGVGIALVDEDGVFLSGGIGTADREQGIAVGPDTCFRVGSISKTFIALTVMRLVERGELDLERPIREYAPDLVADNPWQRERAVTLAHVLEHTAGFDDMRFNESGDVSTPEMSVPEALAINPRSRISRWRPGSRMAYANPGTTVAAHVLERVTGEPFEEVVRREVLDPLGIAPAGFRRTPALDDCLAQGYAADGVTPQPYWSTPHRAAGHLMLSPRQLGELVHLYLRRGDGLLRTQSIARMERADTREHSIAGLAYALANYGDFSLPAPSRGHDGGLPGFASQYRYFPALGVGYVLSYNTSSPRLSLAHERIRRRVFETLTQDMRIDPVAVYPATEAELERWVGSYELVSPRHEIFAFLDRLLMTAHIERGEHGLRLRLGIGPAVPLVAVAPDQLTLPGFSGPVLQLDADGDLLLGDSSYARRPAALLTARALAVTWSIRIVAFAPLVFALLMLGKRRTSTSRALASPLAAVAGLWLLTLAFVIGLRADVLGHVHPWTVLLFVASLFAPAAAGLALARSIRGLCGTPPALARASALLVSAACFVLVVWLHAGHFVALRTWAW